MCSGKVLYYNMLHYMTVQYTCNTDGGVGGGGAGMLRMGRLLYYIVLQYMTLHDTCKTVMGLGVPGMLYCITIPHAAKV